MSLTYTTGNPSNLTAGATANMTDIQGPFTDIKTWADAKFSSADLTTATLQTLGMNSGSQVGRGKSIIVTSESRSNVAYGTLTTPDQVAGIVLPTDGLIVVGFQAAWNSSVSAAGNAAIFVGATQAKGIAGSGGSASPVVQEATIGSSSGIDYSLSTMANGLVSGPTLAATYTGDVTTGQFVSSSNAQAVGGPSYIFAAAGTYTISVQFKATSGSVTVKNRKLWVWTIGF